MILRIENPSSARDLDRADLERIADPASGEKAGRFLQGMVPVPFRALEGLLDADPTVTHATFHASDGYAASISVEQARADGVVLVPMEASRTGVRLVVSEGGTTCLNVKAVTRVELTAGPGLHTVDPNPHTPARVPGWDDRPS